MIVQPKRKLRGDDKRTDTDTGEPDIEIPTRETPAEENHAEEMINCVGDGNGELDAAAPDAGNATKPAPRKIILECPLCPGDIMTLTAAVESIHRQFPGAYLTDVRTPVPDIWHCNPWISAIDSNDPEATTIGMHYPQIHKSNQIPHNFIGCYTEYLAQALKIPLRLQVNRPYIYLAHEEKKWMTMLQEHFTHGRKVPFWLVCAGSKSDYTAKQWPWEYYQEVIDRTIGRVQWVQVGANDKGNFPHCHPELKNCINLVGKTSHRMLHRLVYHACGGLGGVTYLLHLAAAFEKPYIYLAGGREPVTWINYPQQHTLHTIGQLSCCKTWSCWKARIVPIGDGRDDPGRLCEQPIIGMAAPVGRCMAMIRPDEVVRIIERQLEMVT